MIANYIGALGLVLFTGAGVAAVEERADWKQYFAQYNVTGTVVIVDERPNEVRQYVYNPQRAQQRFSPASTFKIPHTLFALDAGVVADEFTRFAWDGNERSITVHNSDQDLRSAMRVSAVWVYEQFAEQIGESAAQDYVAQVDYGNADSASDKGAYWLEGNLRISPYEQIAFLQQLYRNELPFSANHQRLVKDLIITQAGPDWILRGKTGWDGEAGWWVGWVEHPQGAVFFALHIDTPRRMDDLPGRELITRHILISLDALPASGAGR